MGQCLSVCFGTKSQTSRKKLSFRADPTVRTLSAASSAPSSRSLRRKSSVWSRLLDINDINDEEVYEVTDADLKTAFQKIAGEEESITQSQWVKLCHDLQLGLADSELERVFGNIVEATLQAKTGGEPKMDVNAFMFGVRNRAFLRSVVSVFAQQSTILKKNVPATYDYTKPTDVNHKNPDSNDFIGSFREFRQEMDYTYHVNYTQDRQMWQDSAVLAVAYRSDPQPCPWIVYTCGPMGAGKGYALSWMSQNKFFPLENIVHIDPDHFKQMMPEWPGYVAQAGETAGAMCHRESGYIAEIAQQAAMQRRQHVWVDGSLRNGEYYAEVFDKLRARYPEYRFAIFYVYCTEATVRQRCAERARRTGRSVPEHLIKESLKAPTHSLSVLTPKVDFLARIENETGTPKLTAFEMVDRSGCFALIQRQFANTHAPPASFPNSLAPLRIRRCSVLNSTTIRFTHTQSLDTITSPEALHAVIDTSQCARLSNDVERLLMIPGVCSRGVAALLEPAFRRSDSLAPSDMGNWGVIFSPPHPVNLDERSRATALIPNEAHAFVFCYPAFQPQLQPHSHLSAGWDHGDLEAFGVNPTNPDVLFLLYGGFVYFDLDNNIVAVNAMGSFLLEPPPGRKNTTTQQPPPLPTSTSTTTASFLSARRSVSETDAGTVQLPSSSLTYMQFGAPTNLSFDVITQLDLQGRWRRVTLKPLVDRGALAIAFVRPGERFGNKRLTQFGGLAFLYIKHIKTPAKAAASNSDSEPVIPRRRWRESFRKQTSGLMQNGFNLLLPELPSEGLLSYVFPVTSA